MKEYKVIGLMSGTSLDGVDIAYCIFRYDERWDFEIIHAETVQYPSEWIDKLTGAFYLDSQSLSNLDVEYGRYLGNVTLKFIQLNNLKPDFISSHGHTIFHQPEKGYTLQIGDGRSIFEINGLPVVYDFRTLDVKFGGQGAPLVPIGDRLLFPEYDYCLNLGGIANISYEQENNRIAYDICPFNQVLNQLAQEVGKDYDAYGEMAKQGKVDQSLLENLDSLAYYSDDPPKSLGREWVDRVFIPLLNENKMSIEDKLTTSVRHFAHQIATSVSKGNNVMVTGGGAYNTYFIEQIRTLSDLSWFVPSDELINYKEALIFAFLGVLRWRNEINCLSSVTGASKDSSCGIIVK